MHIFMLKVCKNASQALHVTTLLWESVRMKLTLSKLGLGSPLGFPKLQNSIAGVKTLCIRAFCYIVGKLGKCRCWKWPCMGHLDICNTSYGKKKGREWNWQFDSRPQCVQVECNTPLERSWGELQVCFSAHPNRRSKQRVMIVQSLGNPNQDNFGIPTWESQDKKPFGCGCRGEAQSILYGGRWWLPPSPGRGESCESRIARGLS
jgi:hypothetical protein